MATHPRLTFVLGGARSGKSRYAESVAEAAHNRAAGPSRRLYLATAEAFDREMQSRVAEHQRRRGSDWDTVDVPLELVRTLSTLGPTPTVGLLDCVSVWVGNLLHHERDVDAEVDQLIECVAALRARDELTLVVVGAETGLGIVPDNALARRFRDGSGRLNQRLAAMADRVVWVAAGIPVTIKDTTNH
ncbi:MAG: bifunctional adenosylcobinamide kinase/adenosylcobinamide-phosphate guanylyltransferase [Pseudomonadota bacterium]